MLKHVGTDHQLSDQLSNSRWLAKSLKSVRQHRQRTTSEIAAALGLTLRTYERWETGKAPVSLAAIVRFSNVTDCDPIALIVSVFIRDPDFAVDAADNKLALMVIMTLADLHDMAGVNLQHLGKTEILRHLRNVLEALGTSAQQMAEPAEQWMKSRLDLWAEREMEIEEVRRRYVRKK